MGSTAADVLVTGATGRIGRLVVDGLLRAGARVRALTRRPERAMLPVAVDVVPGDFTNPASLDAAVEGVSAIFLVWTASVTAAAAAITARVRHDRGARHIRRSASDIRAVGGRPRGRVSEPTSPRAGAG